LARAYSGGSGVVVTECAYHGNTALVTGVSPSSLKSGSLPPEVRVVPAPSRPQDFAGHVAAAIADLERNGIKFAALLVDSIFSSDGVYADPPGFLAEAAATAHRANGMFIADEVQPGFARTGTAWWGFQRHDLLPDIVTMGKPMGNGYPIGAVVTRPEILSAFCETVGYFNTFGGTPAAAAAGQAVLEVIEQEGLMENARRVGAHLRAMLGELARRHPVLGEIRGAGLYVGVDILDEDGPDPAAARRIINELRDRHVLIGAAGRFGHVLKIRPPLCFSPADAERLIDALAEALSGDG
jgi:4-aminobutyrate aminotransferase-like enzyme